MPEEEETMENPNQPLFSTLLQLQAKLHAIRLWFDDKIPFVLLAASVWGMLSFFAIPDLHRAIRLVKRGHTSPVVIAGGHSQIWGGGPGGWLVDTKATISGNAGEFPADKLYNKGDHAFFTYSERLRYGVITAAPPLSFNEILDADGAATHAAAMPIGAIGALTISNLGMILLAVLEQAIGADVTNRLRETQRLGQQTLIIGRAALEGLLAAALLLIPIAAMVAAFSISIKMESDSLWTMYVIYGLLVLFLASHVTVLAVAGLLRFFRSKFALDLKEYVAYGASLVAAIHVVRKIVYLTFSDRVLDLSSWWEVAKQFGRSLFDL